MKTHLGVYPGSFDPITMGHIDIIERVAPFYEELIVLIAHSSQKTPLFSLEEKKYLIQESLKHISNIKVDAYEGLTIDYVQSKGASVIVRGLRAVVDFEYEMTMASMNKKLAPKVETILVFASPEYYFISSRGVKEVAQHGGALKGLVTLDVERALSEKYKIKR